MKVDPAFADLLVSTKGQFLEASAMTYSTKRRFIPLVLGMLSSIFLLATLQENGIGDDDRPDGERSEGMGVSAENSSEDTENEDQVEAPWPGYVIGIAPITFDEDLYMDVEPERAGNEVTREVDSVTEESPALGGVRVDGQTETPTSSIATDEEKAEAAGTMVELRDFSRLPAIVRDVEALVIQHTLKKLVLSELGDQVLWVIPIFADKAGHPFIKDAVDIWIEINVTESDLLEFEFEASAHTSMGEKVLRTGAKTGSALGFWY